jgi:hypothetical protein
VRHSVKLLTIAMAIVFSPTSEREPVLDCVGPIVRSGVDGACCAVSEEPPMKVLLLVVVAYRSHSAHRALDGLSSRG